MADEVKKKRGRRKKVVENEETVKQQTAKQVNNDAKVQPSSSQSKSLNVILHLHCTVEEIDNYIRQDQWKHNELIYNPTIPKEIIPFDNGKTQTDYHSYLDNEPAQNVNAYQDPKNKPRCELYDQDVRELVKLKELKLQYYKNEIPNKKIDCFWCTCSYDNDPYYILQHGSTGDILAHGSYCSAPCAVAFLFRNMLWDDSAKLDSYQLMNYYYGSKTNENSIKPACSPYYFLDKYYGNLTIQEFRKLSNSNYMFLCIDKPVTRVVPEIHEDNDRATINSSSRGNYKVKKQSDKSGSTNRNDILKSNFGI